MDATTRTARRIVKARRAAGKARCISTHVARVTEDVAARKAVTTALRKVAKQMRDNCELGRVQTRVQPVEGGRVGPVYRYNTCQMAAVAAAYKPRKAEYKTVRQALLSR